MADLRQKYILDMRDSIRQAQKLNEELDKMEKQGEEAGDAIEKGAGKATKKQKGLQRAAAESTKGLKEIGLTAARWLSGAAVGAVTALAGALLTATAKAVEFNRMFAQTRTLVDETAVATGKMKRELLDLAKGFGTIKLEDITGASYQAISAGVDPTKIQDFLRTAGRAAVGGATDMKTAVDGLTNAINGFGLSVDDSMQVADAFFTAVKDGKTTMAELAANIGTVAADANSLGVSLEEVLSGVAAITKTGLSTSEAFTQLGAVFTASRRKASDFAAIGIDVKKSLGEQGLQKTLQDVVIAASAADKELVDLFGRVEGAKGALTLTTVAADSFDATLKNMVGSAGATNMAFDKMNTQTGALWGQITTRLNVGLINLGERILPSVNRALEGMLDLLEQMDSPTERLIRAFEDIEGMGDYVLKLKVKLAEERLQEEIEAIAEQVQATLNKQTGLVTGTYQAFGAGGTTQQRISGLLPGFDTSNAAMARFQINELRFRLNKQMQEGAGSMGAAEADRISDTINDLKRLLDYVNQLEGRRKMLEQVTKESVAAALAPETLTGGTPPPSVIDPAELAKAQVAARKMKREIEQLMVPNEKLAGLLGEQAKYEDQIAAAKKLQEMYGINMNQEIAFLENKIRLIERLIELGAWGGAARAADAQRYVDANGAPDATLPLAQALIKGSLEPQRNTNTWIKGILEQQRLLKPFADRLNEMWKGYKSGAEDAEDATDKVVKKQSELHQQLGNLARLGSELTQLAKEIGMLGPAGERMAGGLARGLTGAGTMQAAAEGMQRGQLDNFSGYLSMGAGAAGIAGGVIMAMSGLADMANARQAERLAAEKALTEQLVRLRVGMVQNTQALQRATQAIFEQAFVGGDITPEQLGIGQSAFETLAQLATDSVQNNRNGRQWAQFSPGQQATTMEMLAQLDLMGFNATDIFQMFLDQNGGNFGQALSSTLWGTGSREFAGLAGPFGELGEGYGETGTGYGAAFARYQRGIDLEGMQPGAAFDRLMADLEALGPEFAALAASLNEFDLNTEAGREAWAKAVQEGFVKAMEETGSFGLSPADREAFFADLLTVPDNFEGGGGTVRRATAVAQAITEYKANELISLTETILFRAERRNDYLREIRDAMGAGGIAPSMAAVVSNGDRVVIEQLVVNGGATPKEQAEEVAREIERAIKRRSRG